jgi:hypothetical protein
VALHHDGDVEPAAGLPERTAAAKGLCGPHPGDCFDIEAYGRMMRIFSIYEETHQEIGR